MTVVCLLFKFVYNPQMGLLNSFLQAVGLDNLTKIWLGSKKTAMYAVIAVSQWQSTGYVTAVRPCGPLFWFPRSHTLPDG